MARTLFGCDELARLKWLRLVGPSQDEIDAGFYGGSFLVWSAFMTASLNLFHSTSCRLLPFSFCRYKMDINALDELLDAREENKLEAIRALVKDIQETRKKNPEVRRI